MKTKTINIYRFDELSAAARDRAWLNNYHRFSGDTSDYENTLAAFEKQFDIKVYHCNVGNDVYKYSFKYVKAGDMVYAPDGDAVRLAAFMWNTYADGITKGKYYSKGEYVNGKYQYKSRRSNIFLSLDDCPLTGFCADYDILAPLIDCLHYKRFYTDIDALIHDCLDNFFSAWDAEIEYQHSYEYFAEMCDANGLEFLENGELA